MKRIFVGILLLFAGLSIRLLSTGPSHPGYLLPGYFLVWLGLRTDRTSRAGKTARLLCCIAAVMDVAAWTLYFLGRNMLPTLGAALVLLTTWQVTRWTAEQSEGRNRRAVRLLRGAWRVLAVALALAAALTALRAKVPAAIGLALLWAAGIWYLRCLYPVIKPPAPAKDW